MTYDITWNDIERRYPIRAKAATATVRLVDSRGNRFEVDREAWEVVRSRGSHYADALLDYPAKARELFIRALDNALNVLAVIGSREMLDGLLATIHPEAPAKGLSYVKALTAAVDEIDPWGVYRELDNEAGLTAKQHQALMAEQDRINTERKYLATVKSRLRAFDEITEGFGRHR